MTFEVPGFTASPSIVIRVLSRDFIGKFTAPADILIRLSLLRLSFTVPDLFVLLKADTENLNLSPFVKNLGVPGSI